MSKDNSEQIKTDKPWLRKKGQSGNPGGRPKGQSLKEYSREMLAAMTPEERQEYLKGLPKEAIWKMAEGNPPQVLEGNKDKPLIIKIAPEIAEQNDITSDTINNSEGQDKV